MKEIDQNNLIDCYQELANAIVKEACLEYKEAYVKRLVIEDKIRKFEKKLKKLKKIEEECEDFFYSERFAIYTSLDPDLLIERLDKNAELEFALKDAKEKKKILDDTEKEIVKDLNG